jgi:3-methyladenine DNA glycosylase AlkD
MSLEHVMRDLEKAGTEQARKTYRRHGAQDPMFGVSFASLKDMVKRIKVDQELAMQLWQTGNHDARMLAIKIADPAKMKPADLERWVKATTPRMCGGYATMLAAEGPHGEAKCREWMKSSDAGLRASAWLLLGHLATLNEHVDDSWLLERLAEIERSIHKVSNSEREAMNGAVIAIGGRNAALRKAATAAAKRIGAVHVDHGDTACKTPEAASYIDKVWAHAKAKKFDSPAAQERAREPMRTRC